MKSKNQMSSAMSLLTLPFYLDCDTALILICMASLSMVVSSLQESRCAQK